MKKLILFALLLCSTMSLRAQTPNLDSLTLTITVSDSLAWYAAAGAETDQIAQVAITAATVAAPGNTVTCSLTYNQVLNLYRSLGQLPEGIAADLNKQLEAQLQPHLSDPVLLTEVLAIKAINRARALQLMMQGKAKLERLKEAMQRNQ